MKIKTEKTLVGMVEALLSEQGDVHYEDIAKKSWMFDEKVPAFHMEWMQGQLSVIKDELRDSGMDAYLVSENYFEEKPTSIDAAMRCVPHGRTNRAVGIVVKNEFISAATFKVRAALSNGAARANNSRAVIDLPSEQSARLVLTSIVNSLPDKQLMADNGVMLPEVEPLLQPQSQNE